jgi:MFS family permease
MHAVWLSRALSARGIHYGWVMVALTLAYSLVATTAMSIPGVLMVPMSKELDWTIGDISSAMAMRLFLFGGIAPFAGAMLLRYGVRTMIMASASLIVVGLLLAVTMTAKWELWLGIGFLLGVAPGLTALVLTATVATRWFTKRRGLVVGILAAANATGTLLFLPVAAWLSETWGWRVALLPTLFAIAACGFLYALFARNDPADLGLAPYGEDTPRPLLAGTPGNALVLTFSTLKEGLTKPAFWVLFGTFFVCGASSGGLMAPHFVPLCADFGVTAVTAASFLAVMGIFDFLGAIGAGWLSDRYDNRWLLSWYYGLRGLSLIWLTMSDFSLWELSVFAVFFGLDFFATLPPTVRIATQAFGRERAPVALGWIFTGHQIGAGVMAAAAGLSRDALATYLPAFAAAGILCIVAAASTLALIGKRNPAAAAVRQA